MQKTNTVSEERKPIFKTTPTSAYGKILVTMMRFPEAKLLANQFDDLRDTKININESLFNIYVGRNITRRMRALRYEGLINIEPCPDKAKIKIYSLRKGLQVILKDKSVEVYEILGYKAPKKLSKFENMIRKFFNLDAK